MTTKQSRQIFAELLEKAGVILQGTAPHDIRVSDDRFYERVFGQGLLGLGESYMDGWWECDRLDCFFDRVIRANLRQKVEKNLRFAGEVLKAKLCNCQTISRSFEVGMQHYDVGNDLYEVMLDKRMCYTCGYWKGCSSLDEAQKAKLELVCQKIGLKPGMRVMEYGCGFGSFAKYAAENHGVEVTGVTVSKEQVKLGNRLCKGLPVEIRLADYRTMGGRYDRVLSIGMLEHVGPKNYRTYMEHTHELLKDDGLAFFHTIGSNESNLVANSWTNRYIFPNSVIPSIAQLAKAMEGLFVMEDWHNFGEDYDRTLMAWCANVEKAWPALKHKYGERFRRMWRYYLLSCAGAFRARALQVWQVVMTKQGRRQPVCRLT